VNFVYGNNLPLWYAHYQSPPQPNFDDFSPFAGWSTPYAKQYAGDTTLCGMSVDLDYTPNSGLLDSEDEQNSLVSGTKQSVFVGNYADPNHPGCLRNIEVKGNAALTLHGSDSTDGSDPWTVFGKIDPDNSNNIVVDFSPKGGPSNLHGSYDFENNGIRWEDNNLWSKL
jgi:hypothetical protein